MFASETIVSGRFKVGSPGLLSFNQLILPKFMQFTIFLEDLKPEMLNRIKWVLRDDLKEEIDEAVAGGIDQETAENEAIDNYLNTHNFGIEVKL